VYVYLLLLDVASVVMLKRDAMKQPS